MFLSLGLLVLYFILFGTTFQKMMILIFQNTETDTSTFFFKPQFYILLLAVLNLPPIYKREIKELQILSIILFVSIFILAFVCLIYLLIEGTSLNVDSKLGTINTYWDFKFSRGSATALAVFCNAYSFQITLFSTYQSLKVKTTEYATKAVVITLGMSTFIYLLVTFAIVYLFGSAIETSFFKNLGDTMTWENITIRAAFIIILICHIPYIFFACKESLLAIIDELTERAISTALDRRLIKS